MDCWVMLYVVETSVLVFVKMNGHHNKKVKVLILQLASLPAIGSEQGSKLRIVLTVLYAEI